MQYSPCQHAQALNTYKIPILKKKYFNIEATGDHHYRLLEINRKLPKLVRKQGVRGQI